MNERLVGMNTTISKMKALGYEELTIKDENYKYDIASIGVKGDSAYILLKDKVDNYYKAVVKNNRIANRAKDCESVSVFHRRLSNKSFRMADITLYAGMEIMRIELVGSEFVWDDDLYIYAIPDASKVILTKDSYSEATDLIRGNGFDMEPIFFVNDSILARPSVDLEYWIQYVFRIETHYGSDSTIYVNGTHHSGVYKDINWVEDEFEEDKDFINKMMLLFTRDNFDVNYCTCIYSKKYNVIARTTINGEIRVYKVLDEREEKEYLYQIEKA
jgi:hypothetical protein